MRSLLTIAFVLLAPLCFSQAAETYEIQEDGGGDYTTVQAAETAQEQDLTSTNKILTFEIQEEWTSADGATLVDGWTTDATRFLTITTVGAARASATFSTTAYRAEATNAPFTFQEDFTVIDGIQSTTTETGATTSRCINTGTSNGFTVKNCFVKSSSGSDITGIWMDAQSGTGITIRNCVVIDCSAAGMLLRSSNGGVKADNNTVENCVTGIQTGNLDVIVRNNILWGGTTPLTGNFNTTTLSEENYTDAGSLSYGSCGSCGTGDQVSQSDPFENLAGENYLLAAGATAIDAGKDLSGDFTDAIGGKTRTDGFFDKGADEFMAAAGGKRVLIRKAMMFIFW